MPFSKPLRACLTLVAVTLTLPIAGPLGCGGPSSNRARPRPVSSLPPQPPATPSPATNAPPFEPLFPRDGLPTGWFVRSWNDVSQPAPPDAVWLVDDGVLRGSRPRGTWLISEREYGNFVLAFDFRLGERGRGGVGLRFPSEGDPASTGLEVLLVDPRYFGTGDAGRALEFTGGIAQAVAASTNRFQPDAWNSCLIRCRGPRVTVELNGGTVLDLDLDLDLDRDRNQPTGELAAGRRLAERPRTGRLGFREISRGSGRVEIRSPRLQVLP